MTQELWTRALVVLVVVVAGASYPARAAEFRCWSGGLERRIELSSADDTQGIACEVRYWRDATAPDSGRVLWHAQNDAAFCSDESSGAAHAPGGRRLELRLPPSSRDRQRRRIRK